MRWRPGSLIRPCASSRPQDIVTLVDFAPTFLDIAGADIPPQMDGLSMLPALHNNGELVSGNAGWTRDGALLRLSRCPDLVLSSHAATVPRPS